MDKLKEEEIETGSGNQIVEMCESARDKILIRRAVECIEKVYFFIHFCLLLPYFGI